MKMCKRLLTAAAILAFALSCSAGKPGMAFKLGSMIKNSSATEGTSSSSVRQGATLPKDKTRSESDIDGIKVKIKTCKRDENDNVTIVFTLENETEHGACCQMRSGSSVAYDDEGNSYSGNNDDYSKSNPILFSDMNGRMAPVYEAKLPAGIPVKYKMRIRNVDPDATMIKRASVFMYELPIGSMTGSVHMINIPISRPGD